MARSSLQRVQLDFWSGFAEWLRKNSDIRPPKPCQQAWVQFGIGHSGFHIGALITRASRLNGGAGTLGIQIELVMKSDEAKTHFKLLAARRTELEKAIGQPLVEHNDPAVESAKLWVRREIDFHDGKNWNACFEWLGRYLQTFKEVFGPIVKTI